MKPVPRFLRKRRTGLMKLLEVDELQANAILDMQLRRIAALERQKIIDEHDELMADIKELNIILASPEKQRAIIKILKIY